MHELFHTEECALSLICRCCRGPTCERRLARSDCLRVQQDLWPVRSWHQPVSHTSNSEHRAKSYFAVFRELFRRREQNPVRRRGDFF